VTEERTTNVTLKTTLSKDGRLVYSAEDAAHDAKAAHELQTAYTAALTALEASDSDRQKLRARIKELEADTRELEAELRRK
jgi:septal ring factor EnvC (AmiA/AmiB activator)